MKGLLIASFRPMQSKRAIQSSVSIRLISAALALSIQSCGTAGDITSGIDDIRVPAGFRIEVFVDDVPNARSMALGESTLFVGSKTEGKVYAIPLEETESGPSAGTRSRRRCAPGAPGAGGGVPD